MSFLGEINGFANSINPFKGPTDWLTNNTLAKLPVVGKPLGQLADWGDSHPAQVGAAIGAAFGGEALLGADAGAAGGAGATAGGVGADGVGSALTTSSGFGGVGTDGAVSGLDGASIDPALAGDDIDAGGGWNPATGGSGGSGANWQQMARMLLSHQQGSNQQGSGMGQTIQFNQGGQPQSTITPQQRMAQALLASGQGQNYNPQGQYSPMQGMSQVANAALAAYLMNMQPNN